MKKLLIGTADSSTSMELLIAATTTTESHQSPASSSSLSLSHLVYKHPCGSTVGKHSLTTTDDQQDPTTVLERKHAYTADETDKSHYNIQLSSPVLPFTLSTQSPGVTEASRDEESGKTYHTLLTRSKYHHLPNNYISPSSIAQQNIHGQVEGVFQPKLLNQQLPPDFYPLSVNGDGFTDSYRQLPLFGSITDKSNWKAHHSLTLPYSMRCPATTKHDTHTRERSKTHSVNDGFLTLRRLIPTDPPERKLSKIETLRLATSYMWHLNSLLVSSDTPSNMSDVPNICGGTFQNGGHDMIYVTCCGETDRICTFCVSFLRTLKRSRRT